MLSWFSPLPLSVTLVRDDYMLYYYRDTNLYTSFHYSCPWWWYVILLSWYQPLLLLPLLLSVTVILSLFSLVQNTSGAGSPRASQSSLNKTIIRLGLGQGRLRQRNRKNIQMKFSQLNMQNKCFDQIDIKLTSFKK